MGSTPSSLQNELYEDLLHQMRENSSVTKRIEKTQQIDSILSEVQERLENETVPPVKIKWKKQIIRKPSHYLEVPGKTFGKFVPKYRYVYDIHATV